MHRHGSAGESHGRPRHQPQHRRTLDGRRPGRRPRRRSTDVILPTESAGIDVAPAHIDLASTEGELFTALGREQILREALEGQIDAYDYVLIDCPPNLGLLTVNGLVAATGVIIPVQTQYYAMKGLTNLVKVINAIRLKLNRDLRILGLLPTFYDGRTNLARDMLDELRVVGDHHVFNSIVRNTVKLGEAPLVGRPITTLRRRAATPLEPIANSPGRWSTLARTDFRAAAARRLSEERELSPAIVSLLSPDGPTRIVGVRIVHDRPDRAEPRAAAPGLRAGGARRAGGLDPRARRPPADPRPTARTEHATRSSPASAAGARPRQAGLATIPALIEEIDDDTALEIAIIENLQREDLSPLDEAAMYDRMVREHGYSIRKLADKLGKDKGYLENRLRLADAPPEIRELVSLRKDSLSHAYELMKVEDPKKRRRLAAQVARGELTLIKLRDKIEGRRPRPAPPADDATSDRGRRRRAATDRAEAERGEPAGSTEPSTAPRRISRRLPGQRQAAAGRRGRGPRRRPAQPGRRARRSRDVDRANLAKYLTIAKLKLENAIAIVRSDNPDY